MKKETKHFIMHSFVHKWQAEQHKKNLETFGPGEAVFIMDFSENASFKFKREVQQQFFSNHDCVLFVLVSYRHSVDGVDQTGGSTMEQRRIVKEQHFVLSDDREKGVAWVKSALDKILEKYNERGINFKKLNFWSDGCAGQFKSCHAFLDR